MSSNEEDYGIDNENGSYQVFQGVKKRRVQRACDVCRKKKVRCDGGEMPRNRCSNCITNDEKCTYVEAAKKRTPKGYVKSLETRLEKMEMLLQKLCPDESILEQLDKSIPTPNPSETSTLVVVAPSSSSSPSSLRSPGTHPTQIATSMIRHIGNTSPRDGEAAGTGHLTVDDDDDDGIEKLSVDLNNYRFFGKSSGRTLIQTAMELKREYAEAKGVPEIRAHRSELGSNRPEFWSLRPWEKSVHNLPKPSYSFPPPDLMHSLISLYFDHYNLYVPLLHRPTFERSIAEGLHNDNEKFAATVMLVCAIGAKLSDDPRVLPDGDESFQSAGWKYFEQVQVVLRSLLDEPVLYDLQFYCLSILFLQGSSTPMTCWILLGVGIRIAQDVGAHRRKVLNRPMTAEDELWKRAFWVLICMDRMMSSSLGRPCGIHEEDFDLDLPIECDDEYWDHPDPEKRFKQPPGKPSLVTEFLLIIKLCQVIALTLRTIYSINKSKIRLGFVGKQWEQHIIAELDSALNKWADSVPEFLRWDPNRESLDFFNQSAVLYSYYYSIQILVHRPFIPSPSKPSLVSFPSLAICTNAARSCAHVIDVMRKRNVKTPPMVQQAAFTAGIVLLLSIWGGKRSGLSTTPREMVDVHKCMNVLSVLEDRWISAGRLWDILYELASIGDLPLPQPQPMPTAKRSRDAENLIENNVISTPASQDGPRNIAGSRRIQQESSSSQPISPPPPMLLYTPLTSHLQQPSAKSHQQTPLAEQSPFSLPENNDDPRRRFSSDGIFSEGSYLSSQDEYWLSQMGPSGSAIDSIPNYAAGGSSHSHTIHHPRSAPTSSISNTAAPSQQYTIDTSAMMFDFTSMGYPTTNIDDSSMGVGYDNPNVMTSFEHQRQQDDNEFVPPLPLQVNDADPQQVYLDSDTMAMWLNAPAGFELDEWGTYLSSVSELALGHASGSMNPGGQS